MYLTVAVDAGTTDHPALTVAAAQWEILEIVGLAGMAVI